MKQRENRMLAKSRVFGFVAGLLLSSLLSSHATAASLIPAGTTGPDWASGARNGSNLLSFFWSVQGNQLDTCGRYSIGDNRTDVLTWNDIAHPTNRGRQNFGTSGCKYFLYGLQIIPKSHSAYSSNCQTYVTTGNTTQYDSYYNSMAEELATFAPNFMIIRVGWELNHSFPWSISRCDTATEVNGYKNTHRKIVTKLRAAFAKRGKSFVVSWSFTRESNKLARRLSELYPGDSYVDTIGLDYYDRVFPKMGLNNSTDAKFKEMASRGSVEYPWGLYTWYAFAMSMKKPFSVDEWGINNSTDPNTDPGVHAGDNAVFIKNMFNFFASHKYDTVQTLTKGRVPALGFENYFNYGDSILGTSKSPKASAMYRSLWSQ
jgi:hypothetical protein